MVNIKKARIKEYQKQYRLNNKENSKQYLLDNKEKISEQKKEYYLDNKEKISEYQKQYRLDNKENSKQYCLDNKENSKQYCLDNKDKISEQKKEYYLKNKENIRIRDKKRRYVNIEYRLTLNLRRRVLLALQGKSKSKRTLELLGCTVKYLIEHLEKQFQPGMNWQERHLFHIDHIRPCSSFDLTDPKQQSECFNYTNLQPLWAIDNMVKGDKW